MSRLPLVGVLGSGIEPHVERAAPLGRWLATEGVHLLTGGGGGVMAAVSQAFAGVAGRRGLVIGILPARSAADPTPPPGYPNAWVELAIATHLALTGERGTEPLSRNHITVLSADVLVALPGGAGTRSEVLLALRYGRPVVAWLDRRGDIPDLPETVPLETSFEGVQAFVRRHLAALDRRGR
jgi:uncharacterized protein (TIGR00725 family)